jgi:uncharacterized protein (TIGR00661 family)
VPIIKALISNNYEPILASDGDALLFLQKEFPSLKSYQLPSYRIQYPKKGKYLKLKLLLSLPSILFSVKKEREFILQLIEKENIKGIISDNRFGVFSSKIPSVYITHQLNVLSGKTTWITSKIHQKIIAKFNQCWVPDVDIEPNFSGELGHVKNSVLNLKYIGILSRLKLVELEVVYDILVLLSGPEPQRTLLENKLLVELKNYQGTVLFVRGVLNNSTKIVASKNIEIVDFLTSSNIENAMNKSELVIARSGYSTIMDLAVLGKKAFFIPTPGQFEQEYLAKNLHKNNIAPFASQENFTLQKLENLKNYYGFSKISKTDLNLDLFNLFKGE